MHAPVAFVSLMLICAAATAHPGERHDGGRRPDNRYTAYRCAEGVEAAFADAERSLDQLVVDAAQLRRRQRDRLLAHADQMRASLEHARAVACEAATHAYTPIVVQAPPPPPMAPMMDEFQFKNLRHGVHTATFGDDKMRALTLALNDQCVTAAQAGRVLDEFTFDSEMEQAIGAMAPHIVDRGNAVVLLEHLSFSSSKARAAALLQSAPALAQCTLPVPRM